jgi:hypothetical protein
MHRSIMGSVTKACYPRDRPTTVVLASSRKMCSSSPERNLFPQDPWLWPIGASVAPPRWKRSACAHDVYPPP